MTNRMCTRQDDKVEDPMSEETRETGVSFQDPPVREVVLGVQFRRLGKQADRVLTGFWKGLGDEWPDTDFDHELTEQFETFDGPGNVLPRLKLQLSASQSVRIRARNQAKTRMIQIQSNRLHYNWLGENEREYPRYETIEPEFLRIYSDFSEFVDKQTDGCLTPNQWEVTYANHIVCGDLWEQPDDWGVLLPTLLGSGTSPAGTRLESLGGHWQFEIPEKRGRLHVELRHIEVGDKPRLVLKLTARGPFSGGGGDLDIRPGLRLGHTTIVDSFRELLSKEAREHFGEES